MNLTGLVQYRLLLVLMGLLCAPTMAEKDPFAGRKSGVVGVVAVQQAYDAAPEEAEVVYVLDLNRRSEGDLVLQEGKSGLVHLWQKDGRYGGSCGGEGQGPGETEHLIRVALGADAVYGYQFPGPITVWPRGEGGKPLENRRARRVSYEGPFAMIFRVVPGADGRERLLLAGQNRREDGLGSVTWHLLDPHDGSRQTIEALTVVPKRPMWDLYTATGERHLAVRTPRAWAALDQQQRLWTGFGDRSTLQVLKADGRPGPKKALHLPLEKPTDAHRAQYNHTPLPILLKTMKELGLGKMIKDNDLSMAYYTFFVPRGEGDLMFVNTIFGAFNCVNYAQNGAEILLYDQGGETLSGRGTLRLDEDALLFCQDGDLVMVRFNHEDAVILERVVLGWVK